MAKLSPMMEQYFEIKKEHPDQILFFRLGDFYEMFFDDAKLASKELELTLTGRDCGQEERAPMCGVPHHSCEAYIARLVQKGYKVAICEQMEDPALAKGIVKREVVRVITPGTVIESNMLDDGQNNYICSVYISPQDNQSGICFADISTGEVFITQIESSDCEEHLMNETASFMPSEFIFNSKVAARKKYIDFIKNRLSASGQILEDSRYNLEKNRLLAQQQFIGNGDINKLLDRSSCLQAVGALISYLEETQKSGIQRLNKLNFYNDEQYMLLDITARTNLELCETMRSHEKRGSLLWVLDKTRTSMGKRMLRREIEHPLLDCRKINNRLEAVGELVSNSILRAEITSCLSGIYDLQRIMTRIVYGSANARELKSMEITLERLPALKQLLESVESEYLFNIFNSMDLLEDIHKLIATAIVDEPPVSVKDGGLIRPGYNQSIDELRDIIVHGKEYLSQIEASEKEKTGIKNLKIAYNKVFGYYLEVTKSYQNLVPEYYIRKQTLTNCERYITQELKELEGKILSANDKIIKLEYEAFCGIRDIISQNLSRIEATAEAVAQLDFIAALASVAAENSYVCPQVDSSDQLEIKDGRHPVVEKINTGNAFVANDTFLDSSTHQVALITGPNMAGKSTYMRQVALIVIMAQIGSFVPCSQAHIGICERIFTRVGASDDLASGQSTFMVEMSEVANILKYATKKSLLILDEIGRGTSTFDGMSIAKAVIEYIAQTNNVGAKALFATHYHELTDMENEISCVHNYNVAVKKRGDDITFLRRIVPGPADDSYGIEVAKLAGIPQTVVERAKQVLQELETDGPQRVIVRSHLESSDENTSPKTQQQEEILAKLKKLDLTTLTPIEAMNILYKTVVQLQQEDQMQNV